MHRSPAHLSAGLPRDVGDVAAGSVAFAICRLIGLDLTMVSIDNGGWLGGRSLAGATSVWSEKTS